MAINLLRMEFFVVNFFEVLVRFYLRVIKKFDIKSLTVGYLLFTIEDKAFDYFLYTAVIIKFGPILGGLIMIVFSAIICLIYIVVYDIIKKDWLGMEAIKEIREEIIASNKWIDWLFLKGRWAEFLFLSLKWDPFVTVAFMRTGIGQYDGMSQKDWKIFWLSVLVSNLWWVFVVYMGVSIVVNVNFDSAKEIALALLFLISAFFEGRNF